MSRFFTEPENVKGKYICIKDRDDLRHMKKVLRLSPGQEVDVSDGVRFEYKTKIISLTEKEAELLILDKQGFAREPRLKVTLYQGVPKAAKMETVIQKCVELGVFAIVPVFTERTVPQDGQGAEKKAERWQKISAEAAKQCRRGTVPQVRRAVSFEDALRELSEYDKVLFPYENEENTTIKTCLRQAFAPRSGAASDPNAPSPEGAEGDPNAPSPQEAADRPRTMAVIIGPEGGFSDGEAAALTEAGAESVSLGKTILRTETAGPAALAMIMYEAEL